MDLRNARPKDAARLTRIARDAKAHWGYPDEWLEQWREELTITESYLSLALVRVAEEGEPVAFCAATILEGVIWSLDHLWVSPEAMGQGIGRRLYEAICSEIHTKGGKTLRIESDPNAAPFYERMGAVQKGEIESSIPGRTLPVFVDQLDRWSALSMAS